MSGSQRTPSRAPSAASNKNHSSNTSSRDMANNTALLGALLAFGGANKTNGDLVRSRGSSPGTPGGSLRGRQAPSPSRYSRASPAAASTTATATATATATSTHDANRARANTQRPTPPPVKPKPRRLSDHHYRPKPISPATSFVGILENTTPRPPTPRQTSDATRNSVGSMEVRGQAQAAPHERKGGQGHKKDAAQYRSRQIRPGSGYNSNQKEAENSKVQEVPTKCRDARDRFDDEDLSSEDDSSQEYVSASEDTAPSPINARKERQPPTPPPTRSSISPGYQLDPKTSSHPIDIARPPRRSLSSTRSLSSHSNPSLSATYYQLYPRRKPQVTLGEDLANAMVASSLAASRASSPSGPAASVPHPRRHSHLSPWHSRNPSPTKRTGMRHTLRDQDSSSSESDAGDHPYGKHKKKRHLRPKHPNKHHEGDRKRWRDAVTEPERKRYEGLFASNRGLLLPPTLPNNVSNIVVKDLWSRSRLPHNELETIWNLVILASAQPQPNQSAQLTRNYLSKEEFVVGLWLIDQRLKGRKLPVKVSDTVWTSVKGLQGIKVKKFVG